MNNCTLIGNMTNDIETKTLSTGTMLGTFDLALTKVLKGEKKTSFIRCKAFGRNAEIMEQYTSKGSKVGIIGEIEQERWEANDGAKKSRIVLNVGRVELLTNKQSSPAQSTSF